MNQFDNVERRDTSGTDKTAGSSFQDQQDFADCVRRQRQAYDVSDLAEEIDDLIVDLIKEGKYEDAGLTMFIRMNATIQRRVAQEGFQ